MNPPPNEIQALLISHPAARRLVKVLTRTVQKNPELATVIHADLAAAAKSTADSIAAQVAAP